MLKNILYLSIVTTIVILFSVGLNIYHNFTSNTISSDTSIQITPIPSGFDLDTVAQIKNRKIIPANLSEKFLSGSPATGSGGLNATPTPTPSLIPTPSLSGTFLSPTPINFPVAPTGTAEPTPTGTDTTQQ